MSTLKISKLDWQIIFFLSVSFGISQLASFFKDQHSEAPMYNYIMGGDVEWWMRIFSYKIQIVWLLLFALFLGLSATRLNVKQALMIGAYGFSTYKDVFDWIFNGNQGTKYIDWIVTILLWIFIETIFWGAKKIRSWK